MLTILDSLPGAMDSYHTYIFTYLPYGNYCLMLANLDPATPIAYHTCHTYILTKWDFSGFLDSRILRPFVEAEELGKDDHFADRLNHTLMYYEINQAAGCR